LFRFFFQWGPGCFSVPSLFPRPARVPECLPTSVEIPVCSRAGAPPFGPLLCTDWLRFYRPSFSSCEITFFLVPESPFPPQISFRTSCHVFCSSVFFLRQLRGFWILPTEGSSRGASAACLKVYEPAPPAPPAPKPSFPF